MAQFYMLWDIDKMDVAKPNRTGQEIVWFPPTKRLVELRNERLEKVNSPYVWLSVELINKFRRSRTY